MGAGTMTPVIANLGVYGATYSDGPCLSYHDSLARMYIGDTCGAYGYPGTMCKILWHKWQREGWIQALIDAQQEIESEIGAPLCPREICDETHALRSEIHLNQKPIAYLGQKVWGDWTEVELTEDEDGNWYVDLCESDLGEGVTPEYVQFAYPDEVLACYSGLQSLQSPCVASLTGTCGAGEDGYRFSWPLCQLVRPEIDTADPETPEHFITSVQWRTYTLDTTLGWELVGDCNCSACSSASSSFTVTIGDEIEGLVCVEGAACQRNKPRRIRFNYATSADCYGPSSYLLGAVVLLALVNVGQTPGKPCGCDNRYIDYMLAIDPTATTEFAHKLRYGPTVAGMTVMRRVDKYLTRRNFNARVATGGFFSASSLRTVR